MTASTPPALEALLGRLVTPRLIFFPIRHHSPACAWHLDQLIRERRPRAVLVEGPASFTNLIPLILDARAKAPFAIYTTFVNTTAAAAEEDGVDLGPPRHAAWYPFCDYSPELVALRAGAAIGAELRFIDLDYPEQVRAESAREADDTGLRADSLLAERHLQRSQYLRALARRAGCRDHNDLWDHFFETRLARGDAAGFIRDVAAWCYMARADATPEELVADGTTAREAAMASAIRAELAKKRDTGPVLVVTGGFHTVVLPELVESAAKMDPLPAGAGEATTCLARYSFEQLDALNGYAAGMPSPFYYDAIWRAQGAAGAEPFTETAAQILVELSRMTRKKRMATALSPADAIAALEQARRLAALRGHPGPTREDVLDGARSCFVKGALDSDGSLLLTLAQHALTGTAVGEVPPEAGSPPLVEDFRARARELRLDLGTSLRRKASLELYRKTRHRAASRFFHSLVFLGVPFATFVSGPDFVAGTGLDRIIEHWDWQWTPLTEARLIDVSIHGATVESAAADRLARAIVELETRGQGRNAREAVAMLVHACRMGLHRHTGRLLTLITEQVNTDPVFPSLVAAMNQLVLLWQSREPLEAHQLPEIPELVRAAYARACYLLHTIGRVPAEAAQETLDALSTLRGHAGNTPPELLDPDLFWPRLEPLPRETGCNPLIAGGAAGLLFGAARLDSSSLIALLDGFLDSAMGNPDDQVAFLSGLLKTCRELAWSEPALLEAIDRLLAVWGDEEFVARLPHLRVAFAHLTPRETDEVGAAVARFHGAGGFQRIINYEFSAADMVAAIQAEAAAVEALRRDGLEHWLPQQA